MLWCEIGPIDTEMMHQAAPTAESKAIYASISPMKRVGTVADVGDSVALLVSESARWISGQNILITGDPPLPLPSISASLPYPICYTMLMIMQARVYRLLLV
jgi:hypothetical protein